MANTVIGLYDSFTDAQQVVKELQDSGFPRDDISLVASDTKGEYAQYFSEADKDHDVGKGAGKGAGIGAVLGGAAGLLVGLGVLAIPGIGPVLAAGPIVSALAGAGIGAAAGGLVGALVNAGVPEEDAQRYAEGVKHGGTLVTVRTDDTMTDQAVDIMNRYNPVNVEERASQWNDSGTVGRTAADTPATQRRDVSDESDHDETTLPVVEEELQVGKRQVQRGGVRVHSQITEKPVEETVNLQQEHVNVRRNPVDRPASQEDLDAFQDKDIEVTETSEEPVVQKRARVVEEVTVSKDKKVEQQTVRDTVRRKDVDVEQLGQRGTTGTYDDAMFRKHYQQYYANSGMTYDRYQPAYRYGYDLGTNDRYNGRDWNQIEADARRDWERTHPSDAWADFRDAIYQGWQSVRNRI